MTRLLCLRVHRNMNGITPPPPHPQSSGVYMWPLVTITCVYMWPSLACADDRTCVYMWPWVSLVCTCDRHLRAQVTVRLKKGLCVYMWPGFACADEPLTLPSEKPKHGPTSRASLRNRNAHGHLSRKLLCENFRWKYRRPKQSKTAAQTLCERAQSKCTWTSHKDTFTQEFTGKMPRPRWSTLI